MKKIFYFIVCIALKTSAQNHPAIEILDIASPSKFKNIHEGLIFSIPDSVYGGGSLTIRSATGFTVNNGTVFPVPGNAAFVAIRNADTTQSLKVDWFIPAYSDTADLTNYIQAALNASNNKTLVFTKGRTYRFNNVYPPLTIKLNGNGCMVKHYKNTFKYLTPLFFLSPAMIKADGTYSGGGRPVPTSASKRRNYKNLEFYGFNYDGEDLSGQFIQTNATSWCSFDSIYIHDNSFTRCSGFALWLKVQRVKTDSSSIIRNAMISNNNFKNNGAFIHLVADSPYKIGAINLKIRTMDSTPIANRIILYRYIQFSTYFSGNEANVEGGGTYNKSNALYMVTGFIQDANDVTKGIITIASGIYNKSTGWDADAVNTGLKSPIKKNLWIIPPNQYEFPLAIRMPKFNWTAGNNKIVRSTHTVTEDANYKNLVVGQSIYSVSITGVYTITRKVADSIFLDRPSPATASDNVAYLPGDLGIQIYLYGDVQAVVTGNLFDGGSRGVSFGGMTGKGLWPDQIPSSIIEEDNIFKYNWMANEFWSGNSVDIKMSAASVTAGDSVVYISNPSNYYYYSKDIDNDGINETILSTSSTSAGATAANSYAVGDVYFITGVQGLYRIHSISSNWGAAKSIIMHRIGATHLDIVGGFSTSRTSPSFSRIYSPSLGTNECVGTAVLNSNKMYYGIRSGGSYFASARVYNFTISNNELYNCGGLFFEIGGGKLSVINNRLTGVIWQGEPSIPGPSSSSAGGGTNGAGSFGAVYGGDITIKGNNIVYKQPDADGFSSYTGLLALYPRIPMVCETSKFEFSNNEISGQIGGLCVASSNGKEIVNGTSFPTSNWDSYLFTNNTISLNKGMSALSLLIPIALNNIITNNTFTFNNNSTNFKSILLKGYPNPNTFPKYNMNVSNNKLTQNVPFGADIKN